MELRIWKEVPKCSIIIKISENLNSDDVDIQKKS